MRRQAAVAILLGLSSAAVGCGGAEGEPAAAPPLPVTTVRVEPTTFRPTLRLLGVVRAAGEAAVVAPARGRVGYPRRFAGGLVDGAVVDAGEPLLELFNEEVEHLQAMARIRSVAADAELERWERALAAGVESEAAVVRYREAAAAARQQLQAARLQTARLVVRAPVAGQLAVGRPLPAGSEVEAGTPLVRVVALGGAGGGARVEGWAAAGDRALLAPGQPVRVLDAGGDRPLAAGTLREVAPELDAAGTLRVVADVAAGGELPPAGEGVELEVGLGERAAALTVPAQALVVGEGGSAVFLAVRQRGLVARRRAVQTGLAGDGRVEVIDGLRPGDRVVVEGAAFVADGAEIVETRAPEAGGAR
jgi:membrane fusion protein (multidrug efflux system)